MPALEIVHPSETDIVRLLSLARQTFVDLPGWSDERVLEIMRTDVVFVAREDAEPAGYVALRRDPETASIVVEQLFVAPGHERRGIGHRLLEYAEGYAIAERAQSLRIVAEEGNWRARDFYRRFGFTPVATEVLERVLPRMD